MDFLRILGGEKLRGEVAISGAKNAALPIIAAALLSHTKTTVTNLPDVADIKTLLKLLEHLGASYDRQKDRVTIDCKEINSTKAVYEIVAKMRASILVLGPLLARFGECEVSLPGGCAIGQRPIDLHLKALEAMGATIEIRGGYVKATAPKGGLNGTRIVFDKITVGGTENILMAAALANGTTKILNAAREPEITQLCRMLQSAGVAIKGVGSSELTIEGKAGTSLDFAPIEVIPDRIEAGTYLCAGAITRSRIKLQRVNPDHLNATISKLEEMGCRFEIENDSIEVIPSHELQAISASTAEYPGFPTDMQAQLMAVCTTAKGESLIEERLFENRFMHASELNRLGANISLKGNTAAIRGVKRLIGADVMATDLRASSALVLAALVAEGVTNVHRIYHLDRGYDRLEEKLKSLGAKIERLKE